VTQKRQDHDQQIYLGPIISKTARDTD